MTESAEEKLAHAWLIEMASDIVWITSSKRRVISALAALVRAHTDAMVAAAGQWAATHREPCKHPHGALARHVEQAVAERLQVELEARGQVIAANDRLRLELAETAARTRELREALAELESAYSERIQSHNHGRTLAQEIALIDKARALLAGEGNPK